MSVATPPVPKEAVASSFVRTDAGTLVEREGGGVPRQSNDPPALPLVR